MNAYNNITWESDRLEYEEGHSPYGNTLLSILGIPSEPRKGEDFDSTASLVSRSMNSLTLSTEAEYKE